MVKEITYFINWLRRRNPTARTWRDYGYDLAQFVAVVGDQPPSQLTFQDIDRFVTAQAERGWKPATINRRLAAIISLYAFLADEDPTLVCPVPALRRCAGRWQPAGCPRCRRWRRRRQCRLSHQTSVG